jgi:hypothetical protein
MADSAKAILQGTLDQYGLGALADFAWSEYLAGASMEQIMLDIRDRPEYKQRFPAMEQLASSGEAITEAAYIDYEKTVRGLLQQYGITPGLYDTPEGIADLLTNRVSASEVNSRLQLAAANAYSAPAEVRDAFFSEYGGQPGDLVSYYLDPDRAAPLIQQQWQAARVMGAATQERLSLQRAEAERLAANGVTFEQARAGFGQVRSLAPLTTGPGERIDQSELIDATFGGADAAKKLARVQNSRRAAFAGGGSAAETQQGVSGLGGASTR